MRIMSEVYWEQGGRSVNKDSLTLQQAFTRRGRVMLAVVSDGIGGLMEGENASGFVTERLTECFYKRLAPLAGRGKGRKALQRCLLRCFYEMNQELRRYGEGREIRLGATVSLLFLWKKRYLLFHLGDSRVYLCRKGTGRLLTRDHVSGGGITRCMGSFPFQYPDIAWGRIRRGSGFLLCTDGFYRSFDGRQWQVLSPRDIGSGDQIRRRLRELGAMAIRSGERDNLSAVYAVVCG